jgi:hypothetical protein
MEQFRVLCVNDRFCPTEFPSGCWIQKNEVYTVVDAKYLARQHMTIGYKLAEIDLPEDSVYQYFLSNRFRPYSDEDEMLEAALEELLEETEVVVL